MGGDLFLDGLLGNGERLGDSFVSGGLDDAVLDRSVLSASLGSLDISDNILKIKFRDEITTELLTIPLRIFPKTTCRPSSHGVLTVVRKNWEPLVSLPALAIESQPAP